MKVKMLVMDVDGTLTDGHIYVGAAGEMMKAFHVQDGYGIAHILPQLGITPVIITGRSSEIVRVRAGELKISHLHQGIGDKLSKLREVAAELGATAEEIAYIGDDGAASQPAPLMRCRKYWRPWTMSANGTAAGVQCGSLLEK